MKIEEIRAKFEELKKESDNGNNYVSPYRMDPLDDEIDKIVAETGYTDELLELEDDIQELRIDLFNT